MKIYKTYKVKVGEDISKLKSIKYKEHEIHKSKNTFVVVVYVYINYVWCKKNYFCI